MGSTPVRRVPSLPPSLPSSLPPSLPPSLPSSLPPSLPPSRRETQAWDLQSLIIKPVQRILKYPLLLDKLVESTTDLKHPDYKTVRSARQLVGQVAQDINEVKRRKDLGMSHVTRGHMISTCPPFQLLQLQDALM